ncbi:hypothetical protein [Methylocucumis oryzae]|uniref:Uncharacterized protein n=1 Tax=Methylocucumis oryzae TaxID=1632867 RepID=A0A0F3IQX4_9GAMM|nr:hypothetical protein [Methylocucumis oryzae]KJV08009.1 hypothetical protein VZ94_00910 [Methylocucumis oryzae]
MIFDAITSLAPPMPDYSAKLRPVYFEPIVGSGERLTIAILAQESSGTSCVIKTLSDAKLQCMYSIHADRINNLIMTLIDDANNYLNNGHSVEQWQPPLNGVYLGDVQSTRSNAGMEGVLFQALTQFSSLYSGELVDKPLQEINGITVDEDDDKHTINLIKQIKELTIAINPKFNGRWQQQVAVNKGIITIDYLGEKYNANLANFNVKQIKAAFKGAQAKLLELEVLKKTRESEVISSDQEFELLVALDNDTTSEAENHFNNLTEIAHTINLSVVKRPSAKELAELIIQKEAA